MSQFCVGLTGGIASGKTTVAEMFRQHGAGIIDADEAARAAVAKGTEGLHQIVAEFGQQILDANGELNRSAMRLKVFNDARARTKLESIVHPHVRNIMEQATQSCTSDYVIWVVPLLIEGELQHRVDRICVVDVSTEEQSRRLQQRDGHSPALATQIMQAQASRNERLAAAHDVIDNNGAPDALQAQVDSLHNLYQQLAQQKRS